MNAPSALTRRAHHRPAVSRPLSAQNSPLSCFDLWPLAFGLLLDMHWGFAQMLAHHASGGCNLEPGDLLGSGTVSGPEKESRGRLLELTWRGSEGLFLLSGEQRRFLADGDEVTFRGWCEREGFARIGFGECSGEVLPAR